MLLIQAIEGQIDKYFSHTKEYFDEKKKQQTLNCHEGLSSPPTLAHSLYITARSLNLNESEFVRMALKEVIDRIQGD